MPASRKDAPAAGRNQQASLQARLEMGRRVASFFERNRLPTRGKWQMCAEQEFNLKWSPALAMRLSRALADWAEHTAEGKFSNCAGGVSRRNRKRKGDDEVIMRKMPCISFELLQWFIDEIVSLQSRSDAGLILDKARELRDRCLALGAAPKDLPKIDKHFLSRWRAQFGISYRSITCRFKVSEAKARERIRVMLGNIFRLRTLWRLVFGDRPMRWLSMDQKPSWFNNAGLKGTFTRRGAKTVTTKTDHTGIRQRYTICTCVQSWPSTADDPPRCAVMFKGSSGPAGTIRDGLQRPEWLLIQVQEKGSYRTEDVLAFLEWALPQARDASESTILLLDWYSAHLSPEVQDLVNRKGHVLLLHGGGVTGMEQVNDTHLHALVQRVMEELETVELYNQRRDNPSKVARLTRQIIVDIVRQMWLGLQHNTLSAKGYRQTGPCLPAGEGVESIYHGLQPFWEKLDGDKLRRDAEEYVEALWRDGSVRSWADAQVLIENHSPHRAVQEGMEGLGWDVESDSDSGGDSDDGGDGPGGPPGGEPVADSGPGSSGDAPREADGAAPASEPPPPDSKDVAWGGICTEKAYLDALDVVADVARKTQDDVALRFVQKKRKLSVAKQKSVEHPLAQSLREAAARDRQAEVTRRAEQADLERRAGLQDLEARRALEEARERTADARRKALEASRILRQEVADRRTEEANRLSESRWLQVDYPAGLAAQLLEWRANLTVEQETSLRHAVSALARSSRPKLHVEMPRLWVSVASFTNVIRSEPGPNGRRLSVRCSKEFEWLLFRNAWASSSRNDVAYMLIKLMDRIAPQSSDLFRSRYTGQVILAWADGVAEKAFVYAVILLSKWLGAERFPRGVHQWPPTEPSASALPRPAASSSLGSSSSSASGSAGVAHPVPLVRA